MKQFNLIYYLLLLLVTMGALASMARNDYGMIICGIASAIFAVAFLIEILLLIFRKREIAEPEKTLLIVQLSSLLIIAIIFFARCFSIEPFVFTPVLIFSTLVMLVSFVLQAYRDISFTKVSSRKVDLLLLLYYLPVTIILVAFCLNLFRSKWIIASGSLIFGLITLFIILSFFFSKAFKNETGLSVRAYLDGMKNKSLVVLLTGAVIFFYSFLYQLNILPDLYFGTYPTGYYKLIETANQKDNNALLLKSQELKKNYELVVEKNALK